MCVPDGDATICHLDKREVCGRQNQNSHKLDSSTATYINIQTNKQYIIYCLLERNIQKLSGGFMLTTGGTSGP